jgi:hypothetical protein
MGQVVRRWKAPTGETGSQDGAFRLESSSGRFCEGNGLAKYTLIDEISTHQKWGY